MATKNTTKRGPAGPETAVVAEREPADAGQPEWSDGFMCYGPGTLKAPEPGFGDLTDREWACAKDLLMRGFVLGFHFFEGEGSGPVVAKIGGQVQLPLRARQDEGANGVVFVMLMPGTRKAKRR